MPGLLAGIIGDVATLRIESGLILFDEAYEVRHVLSALGARWDGKSWGMVLTASNLDRVLAAIPSLRLGDGVEAAAREQIDKEERLSKLRKLVEADAPMPMAIDGLKGSLYNYQKLGVAYSVANGFGILVGDTMGLGKSIQAIATSLVLKSRGLAKRVLVVVPASLKYNWPLEIEKFTDEKYVVIDGEPDERIAQWLSDAFFYVVNYELVVEDLFGGKKLHLKEGESKESVRRRLDVKAKAEKRQRILAGVRERVWDVLILDEAQAIKSHGARRSMSVKRLKAKFKMGLTGTPMDGRLEELHSIMGFIAPGLFQSKEKFFERYVLLDKWGGVVGYKRLSEVGDIIKPFFIRRLKKDVLPDLPDKVFQNKVICLSPREAKVYKALAEKGHAATEDAEAMVAIIRCKQFCDYPPFVDMTCGHNSKLEAFKEVLEEVVVANRHKVLIFSQYKTMVDVLVGVLDDLKLKYLRIDGDTPTAKRAEYQALFNGDKTIDAMIGTEAMSTGLNFQAADFVINYDDNWQPSIMSQRCDRCHRIGQKNVVTVINFICKDTIEERIRDVLSRKNIITARTLGDEMDSAVVKMLGTKEIVRLL